MKKKKHAGGREPLADFEKKFRVVTFISKADVANDRGHKAFDRQVDKYLDSKKSKYKKA